MTKMELKLQKRSDGIPAPRGRALLRSLINFGRTPLEFSERCCQEYDELVDLSIGSSKFYLFNHPHLIAEVLSRHQDSVKDYSYRALEYVLGNGIFLNHGATWKHNRRLMQSAFDRDRFAAYAEQMVADTSLMLDSWQVGEVRQLHREMSVLTVKIIMQTMFGVDARETAAEITAALDTIMLQYFHQAETFFILPNWLPTLGNWRANQAKNRLNSIVETVIKRRRGLPGVGNDLLSTLLNAQDNNGQPLSDRKIRDEVMTLLIAGHETTANAITWTLMLLAQNPEAEKKLVTEIKSVVGDRLPTINDVVQLPYAKMVIQESMRLYPPAWILGRELIRDCNIGGYDFPRGAVIYFSQWAVHRSARWYDEPEKFNPDRWTDNLEQHLPRCAYFPFGAGARACIGKAFSLIETTIVLTMMLQKFRLTLVSPDSIELLPSLTLRPKQGVKMRIISLKDS